MVTRARSGTENLPRFAGAQTAALPWLVKPLQEALTTAQGHALLVRGPQGVGQLSFALALAQAWLCETDASEREGGLACGRCSACHLVDERTHPDLMIVVPETLRGELGLDGDEGGSASDDDGKKRKPSREIRVEQIRTALDFAALTASRGNRKVLVLHPAEALNTVAANALLKTLEEPPGAMRFVLSCGAPDQLLPTIRSRCQDWPLQAPDRAAALQWLQERGAADAEVLLDASGHQPLQALALAEQGLGGAVWREFPASVAQGVLPQTSAWTVPSLVDALQKLCHDALCVSLGAAPRYFTHATRVPQGDVWRLTAWGADLRRASSRASHPWHAPLALEALIAQAREALHTGGPAGRGIAR